TDAFIGSFGNKQELLKFITEEGYELEVTYNELVATVDEKGDLVFKPAQQIKEGDYLVLALGKHTGQKIKLKRLIKSHYNSNDVKVPEYLNEDLAEILGYYMANGSWNNGRFLLFFNSKKLLEYFENKIKKAFNLDVGEIRDKGTRIDAIWFSKDLERYFEERGWKKRSSPESFIPIDVLRSEESVLTAFLRGLFEGSGGVHKDGYPVLYSTSKRLVREVQIALLSLGIISKIIRIPREKRGEQHNIDEDIYQLIIVDKESIRTFLDKIGFISPEKNEKVKRALDKKFEYVRVIPNPGYKLRKVFDTMKNENRDRAKVFYRKTHKYMLGHRTLTYHTLKNLKKEFPEVKREFNGVYDRYAFVKVKRVEKVKKEVFHFETSSGKYVVNGFLVHNKRRGANMGILEVWHPDIFKFIHAKEKEGVLENFNISVMITPDFWKYYNSGEEYPLLNPRVLRQNNVSLPGDLNFKEPPKEAIWGKADPKKLLEELAYMAWKTADPGVLFMDNINKRNVTFKFRGPIRATNPCVVGDTKILVPSGEISIRDLYEISKKQERGYTITNQDIEDKKGYETEILIPIEHKGLIAFQKVKAYVWKIGVKHTIKIELEDGKTLVGTFDHRIKTKGGWTPLKDIQVGEIVYTIDGEKQVIKKDYAGKNIVYDLTVPGYHYYISNGIISHNCGEQPLYPYESCNLGSINLYAFVKREDNKVYFDWEEYKETIKWAYKFLDNIIDVNKYPIPEIEKASKAVRRVGLGFMGPAEALFALKIPYNSEEGFEFIRKVSEWLTYYAMLESVERAKERGVFPLYDKTTYKDGELPVEGYYHKELWTLDWDYLVEQIKKYGIRNVEVTSIAPTGSISMLVDTSSGIEPQFALVYEKRVTVGVFYYVDQELEKQLKEKGLYNEEILKKISENGGSVQGIKELPEDIRKVFITALDIPWWDHVRAQAVAQLWITTSISKTINMPSWVDQEDVLKAYLFAYKSGCKGTTIYRDGSKSVQVYYAPAEASKNRIVEVLKMIRNGVINNKTVEIMKDLGIEPPKWYYELLESDKEEKMEVPKLELGEHTKPVIVKDNNHSAKRCPMCGNQNLVYQGGCVTCPECGWSECIIA
ncbi:MAG TPA: adenosylcobalamin-dependent ribonucleoside-diphosphate reductase, partial [Candidatus Nanopusillus sp.]|nr:adenosylcobalamin-dependent ribonucleoside-diphosphate reductase [Candidatus Nanopusillus sp.]